MANSIKAIKINA